MVLGLIFLRFTEVIELYHGRILDLVCGSSSLFARSNRFVAQHKKNPIAELLGDGVEKTDETGRLARNSPERKVVIIPNGKVLSRSQAHEAKLR